MSADDFETRTPTGVHSQVEWIDTRTRRLELRDASMFGVDGDDGHWHRLLKEHEAMKLRVDVLDAFRGKALLLITVGGSLLGMIAGIAAVIVEKIAGGH